MSAPNQVASNQGPVVFENHFPKATDNFVPTQIKLSVNAEGNLVLQPTNGKETRRGLEMPTLHWFFAMIMNAAAWLCPSRCYGAAVIYLGKDKNENPQTCYVRRYTDIMKRFGCDKHDACNNRLAFMNAFLLKQLAEAHLSKQST